MISSVCKECSKCTWYTVDSCKGLIEYDWRDCRDAKKEQVKSPALAATKSRAQK